MWKCSYTMWKCAGSAAFSTRPVPKECPECSRRRLVERIPRWEAPRPMGCIASRMPEDSYPRSSGRERILRLNLLLASSARQPDLCACRHTVLAAATSGASLPLLALSRSAVGRVGHTKAVGGRQSRGSILTKETARRAVQAAKRPSAQAPKRPSAQAPKHEIMTHTTVSQQRPARGNPHSPNEARERPREARASIAVRRRDVSQMSNATDEGGFPLCNYSEFHRFPVGQRASQWLQPRRKRRVRGR